MKVKLLIDWYDLDLSAVMKVRKQLLPEHERVHRLEFSALDENWNRLLLGILKRNFPGGTVLAELMPQMSVKGEKHHDTVSKTSASFRWGVKDSHDVEKLCDGIVLADEWSLNTEMTKYGLVFWLFGTLPLTKHFNDRIAVYQL